MSDNENEIVKLTAKIHVLIAEFEEVTPLEVHAIEINRVKFPLLTSSEFKNIELTIKAIT